ncbi:unnamed protein product [Cunninghamella blakesleeana]
MAPPAFLNGPDTRLRIIQRSLVLIFTIISLICGLAVIITYGAIYHYDRKRANRVTLRMVFIASVSSVFFCIFNIYNWTIIYTSNACSGTKIVVLFFNAIGVCALACIGLNLLFLFVFRIRNYSILEKLYYIFLIVFPLVSISAPIYHTIVEKEGAITQFDTYHSCWYYTHHFEGLEEITFSWLWYFCVLFVITIISTLSSFIALIRLYLNIRKSRNETELCGELSAGIEIPANVIGKVVIRCIFYALVPFIVNIWSFCLQVIEINPPRFHSPLAVFDAIFSSSSGIFIFAIFFSEPTITSYISERYKARRMKRNKPNDDLYSIQSPLTSNHHSCQNGSSTIVSKESLHEDHHHQHHHQHHQQHHQHHQLKYPPLVMNKTHQYSDPMEYDSYSQDTIVHPTMDSSPSLLKYSSTPPSPSSSLPHHQHDILPFTLQPPDLENNIKYKSKPIDNYNTIVTYNHPHRNNNIPMTERDQITDTAKWILQKLKSDSPL